MKIGVFFGSFNPIHKGHTSIVERFLQEDLDEIWLSVSPHNPLKNKEDLLHVSQRVDMARLATKAMKKVSVTDFEKFLPQPSYTYEALLHLQKEYPNFNFVLLIGGDNCNSFSKWRNADKILNEFQVYAYPRSKEDIDIDLAKQIKVIKAPLLLYASTDIRKDIQKGKRSIGLVPEVAKYIEVNKLYRNIE